MSFSIVLSQTFSAPVTVRIANDKGAIDESKFTAIFKRLPIPELDALVAARGVGAGNAAARSFVVNEVRSVLAGWTDISGADGALPFTAETVEMVLLIPQAVAALHAAFWSDAYGAREKN